MNDGIYPGIRFEQYDLIERVRWSELKEMKRSPAHYRHRKLQPREDTDALKLGRAVHLAAFEPERFRHRYVVWDMGTRRGKDWDSFKRRAEGNQQEILTDVQHAKALAIGQAVRTFPPAVPYLSGGQGELTVLWTAKGIPGGDVPMKSRIDWRSDAKPILDLKTTRDASPDAFDRLAWGYDYHVQGAIYVDGIEAVTGERPPYLIIPIESEPPHVATLRLVTEFQLQMGRRTYRELLAKLVHCRNTGHWPGYSDEIVDLQIPTWALPSDGDPTGLGLGGLEFKQEEVA